MQILEENARWYRGFSLHDKHNKGIFPTSHVQLKDFEVRKPGWADTHTHTHIHLCSTVIDDSTTY